MKHIKDLTEQDCIHCATQEEWDAILEIHNPKRLIQKEIKAAYNTVSLIGEICIGGDGKYGTLKWYKEHNYTIHPAFDFLTPQVSVLTEIGDTKVIRHNDGCIVIKDDKAMTLGKDIVNWIKENL
jgi:hypothetical protein